MPRAAGERQAVRAELTHELLRRAAHEWAAEPHGHIGEEVACGEVVRAVKDEIVRREEGLGVGGREGGNDRVDADGVVDSGWWCEFEWDGVEDKGGVRTA